MHFTQISFTCSSFTSSIRNNNTTSTVGTTELFIVTKSHGNPPAGQIRHPSKIRGGVPYPWEQAIYAGDDDKSVEIWLRRTTPPNTETYSNTNSTTTTITKREDYDEDDGESVVRLIFVDYLWIGPTEGKSLSNNGGSGCVKVNNNNDNDKSNNKDNNSNDNSINSSVDLFYLDMFGSDNRGITNYEDYNETMASSSSSSNSNSNLNQSTTYVKTINERTDDRSFYFVTTNSIFNDPSLGCNRRGAVASVELMRQQQQQYEEEEEEERTTTMISPSPSTSPITPTITVTNIRPSLSPSAFPVNAATRTEIPSSFSSCRGCNDDDDDDNIYMTSGDRVSPSRNQFYYY